MSKDICRICKKVVSDTCEQYHVTVIKNEELDFLDATIGSKSLSDILYKEFKDKSKRTIICDECYDEL